MQYPPPIKPDRDLPNDADAYIQVIGDVVVTNNQNGPPLVTTLLASPPPVPFFAR